MSVIKALSNTKAQVAKRHDRAIKAMLAAHAKERVRRCSNLIYFVILNLDPALIGGLHNQIRSSGEA